MKNLITTFFSLLLIAAVTYSQTPQTISFQGVATDIAGTNLPDGDYMMIFKFYTSETGGSSVWSETQNVSVTNGVFNVLLGSVTPFELPFDEQYWLGVKVESDPELEPRIQLTSSPYSFTASTVDDGAITENKLADGAVTEDKLADGAISQDKLAPGLSLPPGGSAGGDLTGTFPNPTIANNAVTTEKIADHAITEDKLATQIHLGGLIAVNEAGVNCTGLDNVTTTFTKIADVMTFNKIKSSSTLIATFNGRIAVGSFDGASAAKFELRIDDQPSSVAVARADLKEAEVGIYPGIWVTISGTFVNLDAGSHTVSIWVQTIWGNGTDAFLDAGCWSTNKISVLEFE